MSKTDSPGSSRMPDALSSASATSPASDETNSRATRSAIAAQACETCRQRKSRCDEKRPRCGLCTRIGRECQYREPMPTKKDRSITFMMQQLNRVETKMRDFEVKLNAIGLSVSPTNEIFDSANTTPSRTGSYSGIPQLVHNPFLKASESQLEQEHIQLNQLPYERSTSYQHLTTPHKILLWPAIREYMQQSGGADTEEITKMLEQEGTAWFLRLELQKYSQSLPSDTTLFARPVEPRRSLDGQPRVLFANLSADRMQRLATAYFDSYNVLYPLIDQEEFDANILPQVLKIGFGFGDFTSIIALLVFALGQIAQDGVWAPPIEIIDGRESGIRGGDAGRPPGLDIFNEARKRIGYVLTQTSLENIQILQLTAVYYEACCRHLDFWRASVAASMAFQVLVKIEPITTEAGWDSPRGQQMKTVYWTCNLIENWYHMDLDLPRTGIEDHEDKIPLPGKKTTGSQQQQIEMQFLAMIGLRRTISRIHVEIFEAVNNAESNSNYSGPPMHVIHELSRQLDQWRTELPRVLQWNDTSRFGSPDPKKVDSPIELGNSHLRSRYYYARFMIYRPFVYKALHFPAQMSDEDNQHAAECLEACMLWPIALDPARMRKRLIPYLFAWTQNFLGVLLILRMTTVDRTLQLIAHTHLDMGHLERTVHLLLDWFRDMRQVDGMAEWAWNILSHLYSDVI